MQETMKNNSNKIREKHRRFFIIIFSFLKKRIEKGLPITVFCVSNVTQPVQLYYFNYQCIKIFLCCIRCINFLIRQTSPERCSSAGCNIPQGLSFVGWQGGYFLFTFEESESINTNFPLSYYRAITVLDYCRRGKKRRAKSIPKVRVSLREDLKQIIFNLQQNIKTFCNECSRGMASFKTCKNSV